MLWRRLVSLPRSPPCTDAALYNALWGVFPTLLRLPSYPTPRDLVSQFDKLSAEAGHDLARALFESCRDIWPQTVLLQQ